MNSFKDFTAYSLLHHEYIFFKVVYSEIGKFACKCLLLGDLYGRNGGISTEILGVIK